MSGKSEPGGMHPSVAMGFDKDLIPAPPAGPICNIYALQCRKCRYTLWDGGAEYTTDSTPTQNDQIVQLLNTVPGNNMCNKPTMTTTLLRQLLQHSVSGHSESVSDAIAIGGSIDNSYIISRVSITCSPLFTPL